MYLVYDLSYSRLVSSHHISCHTMPFRSIKLLHKFLLDNLHSITRPRKGFDHDSSPAFILRILKESRLDYVAIHSIINPYLPLYLPPSTTHSPTKRLLNQTSPASLARILQETRNQPHFLLPSSPFHAMPGPEKETTQGKRDNKKMYMKT